MIKIFIYVLLFISILKSDIILDNNDKYGIYYNNVKITDALKRELLSLNTTQLNNLMFVYKNGKKHNLELLLAALIWQESSFGNNPINFEDPSCGIFHNHLPVVLGRLKMKDTNYNRTFICGKLIKDNEFALEMTFLELEHWIINRKNWFDIIKSYNTGYQWEKNQKYINRAERYTKEVLLKIKTLEWFFSNYKLKDLK